MADTDRKFLYCKEKKTPAYWLHDQGT